MSGGRAVLGMALVVLLLTLRCDKTFVGPDYKNPRDYTWTVDTISVGFQTLMYDIYATSPSNVYLAGHSSENGKYVLWHFDGVRWSPVQWWQSQPYGISLEAITGFGPSDIYAVGRDWATSQALVLHFNGIQWTEESLPGDELLCISGDSPSDIWSAGLKGSVFHFDGQQWGRIAADSGISFQSIQSFSSTRYALAYKIDQQPQDTIWDYFLQLNNDNWEILDTFVELALFPNEPHFGINSLQIVDGGLYSAGGSVFRRVDSTWNKIFAGPNVWRIAGPHATDIFAVGYAASVYHYNGVDWYEFPKQVPSSYHFNSVWRQGYELFIVGSNGQQTVVLHGK